MTQLLLANPSRLDNLTHMKNTTPTATKIHEGFYELLGFTIRNCSDDYQRAWAVEKNDILIKGFSTLKESKAWIKTQFITEENK
jgi:hypothetical protein